MAESTKKDWDRYHHGRLGEIPRIDDMDQEVWCPNVGEWMTRGEHQRRFMGQVESDPVPEPGSGVLKDIVRFGANAPVLHLACCDRMKPGVVRDQVNPRWVVMCGSCGVVLTYMYDEGV